MDAMIATVGWIFFTRYLFDFLTYKGLKTSASPETLMSSVEKSVVLNLSENLLFIYVSGVFLPAEKRQSFVPAQMGKSFKRRHLVPE